MIEEKDKQGSNPEGEEEFVVGNCDGNVDGGQDVVQD